MHFLFLKLHNGGNHCKFETWYFGGSYYKNKSELGCKAKEMLYGIVIWYRCVLNDVFNVTLYYYRMLLYKIYDFDVKFNYSDINVYFVQTRMQALISTLQGDICRVYESLRNPVPIKNITQTAQT